MTSLPFQHEEMEDAFTCPISQELMVDPVVAPDGHTYEREALMRWLRISAVPRSPLTGTHVGAPMLYVP